MRAEEAPAAGASDSRRAGDDFAERRPRGGVIGSRAPDGSIRKGVDRERVISVDNNALRIQPLLDPGWARAGIAYGPFRRESGLAFAVSMLNGHNTAQSESLPESFRARLNQWLAGPGVSSRRQRLWQWLRSTRKRRMWRQWRWWRRTAIGAQPVPRIDENLALGWYGSEVPEDPLAQGSGLVMHATGAENGEIWVRAGDKMLAAVRGVQNLQVCYVVVLREQGAAYYAASVPGARGLGTHPDLRPLGIDPFNAEPEVYAGLFQSTLGQIGFRLDTRVYGTRVAQVDEWSAWYGTAHAADRLDGAGDPSDMPAEVGGPWWPLVGGALGAEPGADVHHDVRRVVLQPGAPSGLIHVIVDCASGATPPAGLLWRCADADNHWQLIVGTSGSELAVRERGVWSLIASDAQSRLEPGSRHSLQILDDGCRIGIHLDGALLFGTRFDDARLRAETGVGLVWPDTATGARLARFEAHPRRCALPAAIDLGAPWWRLGQECAVAEDFDGPDRELAGKRTTLGGMTWSRMFGQGHIDIVAGGARVRADRVKQNPGRTGYGIEWHRPDFADLEVEITPPGSARGQGEGGRAGLVFWQDDANFLLVNDWLADSYAGASISCFSCVGGFEDLYDAVWSNVGDRVRWGAAHRLRVVFDGERLMALVDDEPVLYRALTDIYADAGRLQIRRVGLLANWEWGHDTGSLFRNFRARV